MRGIYALDDLIGRRFELASQGAWLDQTRRRWAYTGRLLGDPAASVARAMGALFLQPTSALLWNTYPAGRILVRLHDGPGRPRLERVDRATRPRSCNAPAARPTWRAGTARLTRSTGSGWCMLNSLGGPDWFSDQRWRGAARRRSPRRAGSRGDDSQLFGGRPDRSSNDRRPLAGSGRLRLLRCGLRAVPARVPGPAPGRRAHGRGGSHGRRTAARRARAVRVPVAAHLPGRPAVSASSDGDLVRSSGYRRRGSSAGTRNGSARATGARSRRTKRTGRSSKSSRQGRSRGCQNRAGVRFGRRQVPLVRRCVDRCAGVGPPSSSARPSPARDVLATGWES